MKPRVIYPYTERNKIVLRELAGYAPLEVPLRGDHGYNHLLESIWKVGNDVILVEHDVLPWPGALDELWACPCKWGTYSYRMHGGIGIAHGFGCCKLTSALMQALPHIWEGEPGRWDVLDQKLFFAARDLGLEPHLHRPPVIHLSEKHRTG